MPNRCANREARHEVLRELRAALHRGGAAARHLQDLVANDLQPLVPSAKCQRRDPTLTLRRHDTERLWHSSPVAHWTLHTSYLDDRSRKCNLFERSTGQDMTRSGDYWIKSKGRRRNARGVGRHILRTGRSHMCQWWIHLCMFS